MPGSESRLDLSKPADDWRRFAFTLLRIFVGLIVGLYLFVVLVDPYGFIPFSLPIDRRIVSISDRFMYPQIVRSKRFDSLIIGTSTSRLLDPELLDKEFHVHIANLAMSSARAWEQKTMLNLFLRTVGPPKLLIVGIDAVWCDADADRHRITFRGFPDWLYNGQSWKGFLYLLNYNTVEIAVRLVGWHLGLYPERIRFDGYEVFVPPESQYDLVRARQNIHRGVKPPPAHVPPPLTAAERSKLQFPALAWLDADLARLPAASLKIIAFMPVNVAAQPIPGTHQADREAECKARITAIGRKRGATVIDWRIPSPITRNDANYWDGLHYRVPIATRLAKELAAAVLDEQKSPEGDYAILPR